MAQTLNIELPKVPSINVAGGVKTGISAPSMYRTKIPDFSTALNRLIEGNFSNMAKQDFINDIADLAYRAYSPSSSLEERQSVSYVNLNNNDFLEESPPQTEMSSQMQKLGFQEGGTVFGSNYSTFQPTGTRSTPESNIAKQAITGTVGAISSGASFSDAFEVVSRGIAQQAIGRDLNTMFSTYNMAQSLAQYGLPNTPAGAIGLAAGALSTFNNLSRMSLEDIPGQVTRGIGTLGQAVTGFVQDPIGATKTALQSLANYMEYGTNRPTISTITGPYGYQQSMVTGPDGKITTPGLTTVAPVVGSVASITQAFMGDYYNEYQSEFNSMAEAAQTGFAEVAPGLSLSLDSLGNVVGVMNVPDVGTVSLNSSALDAIAAGTFDPNTDLGLMGFQDISFGVTEEISQAFENALNNANLSSFDKENRSSFQDTLNNFQFDVYDDIASAWNEALNVQEQIDSFGLTGAAIDPEEGLTVGMFSSGFNARDAFSNAMGNLGFNVYTAPVSFQTDPFEMEYSQAMSTQGPGGLGTTAYGGGWLDYNDPDEFGNPTLNFNSVSDWINHMETYGIFGGPDDLNDPTAPGAEYGATNVAGWDFNDPSYNSTDFDNSGSSSSSTGDPGDSGASYDAGEDMDHW